MRHPALELLDRRLGKAGRTARLQPLSAGEILDVAASLFRRHGRLVLRLTALPVLFCYLAVVFVVEFVGPSFFLTSDPNSLTTQFIEAGTALLVALFVALPLFLIGLGYASALVCRVTADDLTGHVPDEAQIQRSARKALMPVVLSNLWVLVVPVGMVLVALPFLALSAWASTGQSQGWQVAAGALSIVSIATAPLAAILLILRSALVVPATVTEGLTPRAATKRAVYLLRRQPPHPSGYDHLTNIGLVLVVIGLIAYSGVSVALFLLNLPETIGQILPQQWPIESILGMTLNLLGWYTAFLVTIPLWSVAVTVLYFDRRVRLEAFDLALLDQQVRRTRRESRFVL